MASQDYTQLFTFVDVFLLVNVSGKALDLGKMVAEN
jgi:hypothetical protein